jgi:urease alpha subunit
MMHDLVIRGATVVDGLGHDPVSADGAIQDGRIVAIGEVGKDAPGIVDAGDQAARSRRRAVAALAVQACPGEGRGSRHAHGSSPWG